MTNTIEKVGCTDSRDAFPVVLLHGVHKDIITLTVLFGLCGRVQICGEGEACSHIGG